MNVSPTNAAALVSIKSMPVFAPELQFAKANYSPLEYHEFLNELRRLTTLMFDFYQYDLTDKELYELVHQRNGSLPQN